MSTQNFINKCAVSALIFLFGLGVAQAQSKAYSRKKTEVKAPSAADANAKSDSNTKTDQAKSGESKKGRESEKLDIQELEQKYWAPKDTDFSVVQNRTYTKAGRVAASLMAGPIVSDPFNAGVNYALSVNYYLDERYGFEFMYQSSALEDSDAVDSFRKLSGGGTRPDFNRDTSFYGVGFNYVPFYAKMSFLGKKIIYFDMQFTPFIGMSTYEQQTDTNDPEKSSFSYGLDVTQYFFFSQNFAFRANLHNRFYSADVLSYATGAKARSGESQNTTMFLMGFTYFY